MLDTTNGTLYALSGGRWQLVAMLPNAEPQASFDAGGEGEEIVRKFVQGRRQDIDLARIMLQQENDPGRRETLERYILNIRDVAKELERSLYLQRRTQSREGS